VDRLKDKFQQLEKLMQNKLKSDTVMNSEELQKRYGDIEGQMRQYLNAMRE
jgi:ABC-type phosphate transport system auxiliary subunit